MFVILQKYDFSSKSQLIRTSQFVTERCLWYCKSTIFQANHNYLTSSKYTSSDVCDTAKVRFFKQITTARNTLITGAKMFVILQKYDFSSKSQRLWVLFRALFRCLWYCKSTIFQANHNIDWLWKIVFSMFVILQKYDFSSKSQPKFQISNHERRCLWYCKSTIFQANHNQLSGWISTY